MKLKVLALGSEDITRWISNSLFMKGAEVISLPTFTEKFSEVKAAKYDLAVIDSNIAELDNICFRLIWFCRLRVVIVTSDTNRDWSELKLLGVDAFISTNTETAELAADLEAIAHKGSPIFPKFNVLVIEDDDHICEAIRLCFRIFWPETDVVFAMNGQSGVEIFKTKPADILLLDLGLPDISGFEVLKQIRAFSRVPVVILSATVEKEYIVKAIQAGATDYVVKPFKQIELMSRLKKQLQPISNKK
jgi:DNA-binding response OmpR family regulator